MEEKAINGIGRQEAMSLLNNDKSKPYWVVQKTAFGILVHDTNCIADDEYMHPEYDDEVWAQNVCDHRNIINV